MKIPGSDSNDKRSQEIAEKQKLEISARGAKPGSTPSTDNGNKVGQELVKALTGEDLVNVSGLGAMLNQELNPVTMAAERKQKLEELKKLIKEGKYNPDSRLVSKAISEELSLEIIMQGKGSKDTDLLG